jgi:hypothetical protein
LDLLDECAWSNSAWASALVDVTAETAHRTEHIRSFDPDEKKTAPRPLLVMSGDFDSDQPKHYVLDWFRSVRPAYTRQPEYLRWNIYPVGHTMTRLMEADAADWFVQHLKE